MKIWIEAEHWAPGEWTPDDDNSDVLVTLDDGERWSATFFTFSNIAALREKNRSTGECLSGHYFYATNMVLIDRLTRDSIVRLVEDLLRSGEFESAFRHERG